MYGAQSDDSAPPRGPTSPDCGGQKKRFEIGLRMLSSLNVEVKRSGAMVFKFQKLLKGETTGETVV